jgi:hypothetical protein
MSKEMTEKQRERFARAAVKAERAASEIAARAETGRAETVDQDLAQVREAEAEQRAAGETALAAAAKRHAALMRRAELESLAAISDDELAQP